MIKDAEQRAPVDFTRAGQLTPEVDAAIDTAFTYAPWDDDQITAGIAVREALATACKAIVANVPPGPDRSAAIRKLREARMDANSAISFRGRL
jgi:hypothetical protein